MNDMKISVKSNGVWVVDNQDYYLTDAKDLVWNLFADKFLVTNGRKPPWDISLVIAPFRAILYLSFIQYVII